MPEGLYSEREKASGGRGGYLHLDLPHLFPDGMPWSDDLTNLGKVYRSYHEHMQHWEKCYNISVGRWKKYEPYIKPLLNELGPLVREYEDELASAYNPN